MAVTRADLETDDLASLLGLLADQEVDGLARFMVQMRGYGAAGRCRLPRALDKQKLTGKQLIPDILDDISILASHETGPRRPYRKILQRVAWRHKLPDNGKQPASVIERQVQTKYPTKLRPAAADFSDKGSPEWFRAVGFVVPVVGWAAYAMSPNWRIVTATVLEVAALRRIALMRQFAQSLEEAL